MSLEVHLRLQGVYVICGTKDNHAAGYDSLGKIETIGEDHLQILPCATCMRADRR